MAEATDSKPVQCRFESDGGYVKEWIDPPEGWLIFGSLSDYPGELEFSAERDEDGFPLWERPRP